MEKVAIKKSFNPTHKKGINRNRGCIFLIYWGCNPIGGCKKYTPMKTAQVVHNPSAGNAGHTQDEIMDIVEKAGYSADYLSMEDPLEWDNFDPNRTDTIFLVGGDGTVRKLAKVLLEKMKDLPVPIHLMPLGTANNIARTLRISSVLERHAANRKRSVKSFDCGSCLLYTSDAADDLTRVDLGG